MWKYKKVGEKLSRLKWIQLKMLSIVWTKVNTIKSIKYSIKNKKNMYFHGNL